MQIINEKYKNKYLKYKNKYYNLTKNNKKQTGGDALLVGTFVSIIGLIVLALIYRNKFKLSNNLNSRLFGTIKVSTKKDDTQLRKSQPNVVESKKLYDFDAIIRDDIDRQNKNTLKEQMKPQVKPHVQPQVKPNVQPPVKPLVQTSGVDPTFSFASMLNIFGSDAPPPAAASDGADGVDGAAAADDAAAADGDNGEGSRENVLPKATQKNTFNNDVHKIIGLLSFSIYDSNDNDNDSLRNAYLNQNTEMIDAFLYQIKTHNEGYRYVLIASLIADNKKWDKKYFSFDYKNGPMWNYFSNINKKCQDFINDLNNKNEIIKADPVNVTANIALVIANIFDKNLKGIKFLSNLISHENTNMTLKDEIELIKSLLGTLQTQESNEIYKYLDELPTQMHPIKRIINYLEEVQKYRELLCKFLPPQKIERKTEHDINKIIGQLSFLIYNHIGKHPGHQILDKISLNAHIQNSKHKHYLGELGKLEYVSNVDYYKYILSASIYADIGNEFYPWSIYKLSVSDDSLKKTFLHVMIELKNRINKKMDKITTVSYIALLMHYIFSDELLKYLYKILIEDTSKDKTQLTKLLETLENKKNDLSNENFNNYQKDLNKDIFKYLNETLTPEQKNYRSDSSDRSNNIDSSHDADAAGDDEDKAAIKLQEFMKKFLLRSRLDSFKKNFKQLSCKICRTK